jgi:hypothetical protein
MKSILCGFLLLSVMLGCGKRDPVVGSWIMREDTASAEMILAKDSSLRFGDNNGTWSKVDDCKVVLKMESGVYTAEIKDDILFFSVAGTDVVFVRKN